MLLYLPAVHSTQPSSAPAPSLSPYRPGGQATTMLLDEPAGQKKPASHKLGHALERFTVALQRPGSHSRHAASPEVLLKRPCGHGTAAGEPSGQLEPG